ncbi:MAG: anthranilate phosphoribosyltransferase [Thermodesulfobacteriota bacterium]
MATEQQLREFGRLVAAIAQGKTLSREESREAYRQVILNEQPELQQGAFLMAHIARGPTTEELGGAWDALDRYDTAKIRTQRSGVICDIVGTGSDPLKTINASTPAALIAAACELPVAKKGARLVTGVAGASDILEILGVDLNAPLSKAEQCLDEHGICYLPGEAFLKSGWARLIRSMRFTSAFNIIGPLTRPCEQNNAIVIGAYAPGVCDQLVEVLKEIGMPAAVSPYGMATGVDWELGMDEYSVSGPTRVVELRNGHIQTYEVTPSDFGLKEIPFDRVQTRKTAEANASAIRRVLGGDCDTPEADFFSVNAAAALYVSGYAATYAKGFDMAKQALASGRAREKLEALRDLQG